MYVVSAADIYSVAATEFVITSHFLMPSSYPCLPVHRTADGRCRATSGAHRWMGPGHHGPPGHPIPISWVVPAGQTVVVSGIPVVAGATIPKATCIAVIYEDGAMAGDPAVLRMLLLERQDEYQDAAWAVHLLQQAAAAPGADLGSLAGQLQARFAAHRSAWRQQFKNWHGVVPAGMTGGDDQVSRGLASELRKQAAGDLTSEQVSQRLAKVLRLANAWLDLLANSRPALQPPSI